MKSPFVDGLVPNEIVTAQFLVLSKEIRQKKTGEPYLSLHLADRTGEIEGKMWDNVVEVMHAFERDHFVKVKGLPQLYQQSLTVRHSPAAASGRQRSRSGRLFPLLRAQPG